MVLKKPIKGPSNSSLYMNFHEDTKNTKKNTNGFMLTCNLIYLIINIVKNFRNINQIFQ